MFDARAWLSEVGEAAKLVDAEMRWLEAQRMMAVKLGSPMHGIHTGNADPMARIDAMVDMEDTHRAALESAMMEVNRAKTVFAGMRTIGSMESSAASMMELVHCGLMTKKSAADALGISYDAGKRAYAFGVDWLNAHGLAYAKAGKGLAE